MADDLDALLEEKKRREDAKRAAFQETEKSAEPPGAPKPQGVLNNDVLVEKNKPSSSAFAKNVANVRNFAENYLHLPELGAGILQSFADVPISVANAALYPASISIPHPDFRGMLNKPQTLGGDIASGAGQLIGGIPMFSGLFGAADKLGRPTGYGGLASDALKGFGTGFLGGETGDKGEGRFLSGAIGAIAAPLANLHHNAIAKNIGNEYKALKGKYNKMYEDVLLKGKKEGLDAQVVLPAINLKSLKGVPEKFMGPLRAALNKQDIRKLHKAQSKMGEYIRQQKSFQERGHPIDELKLEAAQRAKDKVVKSLDAALSKSKQGLAESYKNIQSGYKKDVVPYSNIPAMRQLANENITNKDFTKIISGNSKSGKYFRKDLSAKHPEVAMRNIPSNISKGFDVVPFSNVLKVGLGTGLGFGGAKLYERLFGEQ